ncbi:P-II family nitrogen regulator [Chitinibacteraceae bacterium HSL-7]
MFHTRTLLTIVTEAALEKDLVDFFYEHGLKGWTIVEARGKGEHGEKHGSFDANGNIQIELIAHADAAEQLALDIQKRFGQYYALVQWLSDVRVLRAEKF